MTISIPCSICRLILGCLVFTRKAYVLSRNLEAEFKTRSVHVWHNILLSVGQSRDSHLTCRFYSFLAPLTAKPHQISRNIQRILQTRRKQASLGCTLSLRSGKSSLSEMRTEPPCQCAAQGAEAGNAGWLVFLAGSLNSDLTVANMLSFAKQNISQVQEGKLPHVSPSPTPSSPGTFILPKGWSRVLRIKAI